LERRGFSAKQIHRLQVHDRWSSHQVNEITIDGDEWKLWQAMDGGAFEPTGDFGQISVTGERVRLDERTSFLVLHYRLDGDELRMNLLRSTCDVDPIEPIPDFMYASVLGQPYHRQA
jgi:hypothetical protein